MRVVARASIKPEKIEAAKALFAGLVAPTRAEDGCIQYDLLQNQQDPTDFTFVEEWESSEHLEAHLKSAHIADMLSKIGELSAAPSDVRRYDQVA